MTVEAVAVEWGNESGAVTSANGESRHMGTRKRLGGSYLAPVIDS